MTNHTHYAQLINEKNHYGDCIPEDLQESEPPRLHRCLRTGTRRPHAPGRRSPRPSQHPRTARGSTQRLPRPSATLPRPMNSSSPTAAPATSAPNTPLHLRRVRKQRRPRRRNFRTHHQRRPVRLQCTTPTSSAPPVRPWTCAATPSKYHEAAPEGHHRPGSELQGGESGRGGVGTRGCVCGRGRFAR